MGPYFSFIPWRFSFHGKEKEPRYHTKPLMTKLTRTNDPYVKNCPFQAKIKPKSKKTTHFKLIKLDHIKQFFFGSSKGDSKRFFFDIENFNALRLHKQARQHAKIAKVAPAIFASSTQFVLRLASIRFLSHYQTDVEGRT